MKQLRFFKDIINVYENDVYQTNFSNQSRTVAKCFWGIMLSFSVIYYIIFDRFRYSDSTFYFLITMSSFSFLTSIKFFIIFHKKLHKKVIQEFKKYYPDLEVPNLGSFIIYNTFIKPLKLIEAIPSIEKIEMVNWLRTELAQEINRINNFFSHFIFWNSLLAKLLASTLVKLTILYLYNPSDFTQDLIKLNIYFIFGFIGTDVIIYSIKSLRLSTLNDFDNQLKQIQFKHFDKKNN